MNPVAVAPPPSAFRHQELPQVGGRLAQTQFFADVEAVGFDGADRYAQLIGDLLGEPSVADQVGHLEFNGGQIPQPVTDMPGVVLRCLGQCVDGE